MIFSLTALGERLTRYPSIKHFHVALSGGLDSSVLLYAMAGLRDAGADWTLSAVHVHHGLNEAADDWVLFCQNLCKQLDIRCDLFHVDASPLPGESPEATARHLRYQVIAGLIEADEAVLTAHHQDDQAETLLLQLMRGSGLPGLAAMPVDAPFSQGILVRPLLDFSRLQLRQYALQHGLDWVEDSSNEDTRYDRNFMRHEIMPGLASRWPAVVANLSRTAAHMAEAAILLDELAVRDLSQVVTKDRAVINISGLITMTAARQRNLLRYWLRDLQLSVPSRIQMQHVLTDVIHAGEEASPCVSWPGVEARRYRDHLYALAAMSPCKPDCDMAWDLTLPLKIDGVGRLQVHATQGQGLSANLLGQTDLHVRLRQGGEYVRPARRGHQHELKKLFQEAGIPPWERDRTPILYQGETVVAVAGLCECEPFQADEGQRGLLLQWHKCFG